MILKPYNHPFRAKFGQIITCQVSDVWLTDVWLTEFLLIFFLEQVFTYFHIISTKYFFFISDLTSRGGLLYTHTYTLTHTLDLLYGMLWNTFDV